MNLAQQAGLAAAQAIGAKFNNGFANVYSGGMPVNCRALSGNTLLAQFSFSATAFPTWIYDSSGYYKANASFVTNPVTPNTNGTSVFIRMLQTGGSTVIADYTAGQAWAPSLAVQQSQYIFANGNTYVCTVAGTTSSSGPGPTGTGTNISDGSAFWMYQNAGSTDVLLSSATLSTSSPLTMPYLWLAMPCV